LKIVKKAISKKGKKEFEIVEEKENSVILMDLKTREEKEIKLSTLDVSYDVIIVPDEIIDFELPVDIEEDEEEIIPMKVEKKARKLSKDDQVLVSNYIAGTTYISNPLTFEKVVLEGFGDTAEVSFGTLEYIRKTRGVKPFQKYVYIMDKDAISQLNLDYTKMKSPSEFKDLMKEDLQNIIRFIDNAPEPVIKSFREYVISKIRSGEIDSFTKVKVLSEKLGFEA